MTIARRAIKPSLAEYTQQLQLYLTEQIDQSTHVTQELVLEKLHSNSPGTNR